VRSTVLFVKLEGGQLKPHGTGFIVYDYLHEGHAIIVTCSHLLGRRSDLWLVLSATDTLVRAMRAARRESLTLGRVTWVLGRGKLRTRLALVPETTYVEDKALDVAAIPIDLHGSVEVANDEFVPFAAASGVPRSRMRLRAYCGLGDEVFFVGFPLGLGTDLPWLEPALRSGAIAWCPAVYDSFYIDALSFPGNSGSPVYTKRADSLSKAMLIGMVRGHIAERTASDSVNMGLANCVWLDAILDVVHRAANPALSTPLLRGARCCRIRPVWKSAGHFCQTAPSSSQFRPSAELKQQPAAQVAVSLILLLRLTDSMVYYPGSSARQCHHRALV